MTPKTAHDFDQELLDPVRRLRARRARPPRLPRQGRQVRRRRRDRGDAARSAQPEVRRGAGRQARGHAHQGGVPRVRLAEGLRQDARLPGAAGQGDGQAAGGARHPREPRPQPAHRGHRPPARARQLRGLRARRALPARRLSGRRGQGARGVPEARSGEDARGLRRRRSAGSRRGPKRNGKVGAVGFCYGGGMVNFLATRVPELAAGVAFYGSAPNARGRAEDQGAAADPVRRESTSASTPAGRPTRRR